MMDTTGVSSFLYWTWGGVCGQTDLSRTMYVWLTEGCSMKLDIDSDGYHRCLQFLILDLHKSEVGPSNIFFLFFQKSIFY